MKMDEMKYGANIQERIPKYISENAMDKEEVKDWFKTIKLPQRFENSYYEFYKKTKAAFCETIVAEDFDCSNDLWLQDINIFLKFFENNCEKITNNISIPLNTSEEHPFNFFTISFIKYYQNYFGEQCMNCMRISQKVIDSIIEEEVGKIVLQNVSKLLLTELNAAGKDIENDEEKHVCYIEFCNNIVNITEMEKLIKKYPVAFRLIMEESKLFLAFLKEIIERTDKDYEQLEMLFGIKGSIKNIKLSVGDTHRGKKSVAILEFEQGIIVYKPRSLMMDKKFGELIRLISKDIDCDLMTPVILNQGKYGWQEYIESKECNTVQNVKSFYYKMGIYAGVFYILKATDLHMENVVCRGCDPYFIDLESLFQGYRGKRTMTNNNYEGYVKQIRESVLATCLFPGVVNSHNALYDIAGITGKGGQTIPKRALVFEKRYSSDMEIVRKDYIVPEKKNIPILNGELVEPREFLNDILCGFETIYDYFSENKEKLQMFLKEFLNCPIRVILRDTSRYSILLRASTEEKYLRDAKYYNQLFDRLWNMTNEEETFANIINSEKDDLYIGDIPYFYTFLDSTSLYDSRDKEITNFFQKSMYTNIKNYILELSDSDKYRQMKLIRQSMAIPIKRWELKENKINFLYTAKDELISKQEMFKEAEQIYSEIVKMKYDVNSSEDIVWPKIQILPTTQWAFLPMDNTLYEGELGIAIFVAALYLNRPKKEYTVIVEKIIKFSELYEERYKNNNSLSAFTGDAAVAYCYYYLYLVFGKVQLREKALNHLLRCKEKIKFDECYDIIAGCAGTLIVALRIYDREKDEQFLKLAMCCGNHLLENVDESDNIFGWHTAAGSGVVLAGMSHGNAGIAWSLMELYKATNCLEYYNCAQRAIEYENLLYSKEDNNWTDLRNRENRIRKNFPEPVNWCHGAPGIGISRIFYQRLDDEKNYDDDIMHAMKKTLESGFGGSDCMCHGSFGNIEVLLLQFEKTKDIEIYNKILSIVKVLKEESKRTGWICGIPQRTKSAGFMTGLSGIGYGLLRCINPNKIPCVLSFDFPSQDKD